MTVWSDIEELTLIGDSRMQSIFRGIITDHISTMQLGSSDIPQVNSRGDVEGVTSIISPFTDGGFESASIIGSFQGTTLHFIAGFTNTTSEARTIREVGLLFYSDSALAYRQVVKGSVCTVRPGESVLIDVQFPFAHDISQSHTNRSIYETISGTPINQGRILSDHHFYPTFRTTITQSIGGKQIPTAAYARLAKIVVGNITDTITHMQLGSGTTGLSLSSTNLASPYTDGGFEKHDLTATYADYIMNFSCTFTNTSGVDREVRELGMFFSTNNLFFRHVFGSFHDIPNLCIVPAGKSISVNVSIPFASICSYYGQFILVGIGAAPNEDANIVEILIGEPTVTVTMDLTTFDTPDLICYNGVPIRKASIANIGEPAGAKVWEIDGYTENYVDIENIKKYSGSVNIGTSVSGKQFATSAYRQGVLAVAKTFNGVDDYSESDYDVATFTHYLFERCYVDGDISVEPFNHGWFYSVRVVQSAYEEVV